MNRKIIWQTCIVVFFLTFALSSCFSPQSFFERNAPELGKTYILTEDAVLTSEALLLPGPLGFGHKRTVRQIMTLEYFKRLNENYPEFPPLPDEGRVEKGAKLTLDQTFLYSDITASLRYGRGQLSDPGRGEYTVYINLESPEYMSSILEEMK